MKKIISKAKYKLLKRQDFLNLQMAMFLRRKGNNQTGHEQPKSEPKGVVKFCRRQLGKLKTVNCTNIDILPDSTHGKGNLNLQKQSPRGVL